MTNPNYIAGRNAEYRTMQRLEKRGYFCSRTAGSHGPYDVMAIGPTEYLLIQVSYGEAKKSPADLKALECLTCNPCTKKQWWHWNRGAREPVIKTI